MKAQRLKPGDTIGIVSPSWGGAGKFPHRVERGVRQLEELGFNVRLARHATNDAGYVSDTPGNRAADLHEMFGDPSIAAIIAAIGGNHSCHLLPLLDFDLIRDNPKVFMGFSDITVLNVAIWAVTGLVTFNGPSLLTDIAEYPEMPAYSRDYMLRAIASAGPVGRIEPSGWWTDEFLDWGQQLDLTRPRERRASEGWTWLKPGVSEGRLVGGCLESMEHLRGTRFWPDFSDVILFLEPSEDALSPATVDAMLMDYENMGVIAQLHGLLFGRPYGYSDEQRREFHEVITERTARFDFPVIADMDFGHTTPMLTLPIGCRARIDGEARSFEIVEAATRS